MITYSQAIILFVLFVLTIIFDLRERRIPNWLTLSSMFAGMAYHAATGGLQGLIFSIQGLALGFTLLILFYAAGGMGAGDVKLMGAVGSILGPMNVIIAFLYSAVSRRRLLRCRSLPAWRSEIDTGANVFARRQTFCEPATGCGRRRPRRGSCPGSATVSPFPSERGFTF